MPSDSAGEGGEMHPDHTLPSTSTQIFHSAPGEFCCAHFTDGETGLGTRIPAQGYLIPVSTDFGTGDKATCREGSRAARFPHPLPSALPPCCHSKGGAPRAEVGRESRVQEEVWIWAEQGQMAGTCSRDEGTQVQRARTQDPQNAPQLSLVCPWNTDELQPRSSTSAQTGQQKALQPQARRKRG